MRFSFDNLELFFFVAIVLFVIIPHLPEVIGVFRALFSLIALLYFRIRGWKRVLIPEHLHGALNGGQIGVGSELEISENSNTLMNGSIVYRIGRGSTGFGIPTGKVRIEWVGVEHLALSRVG